MYKLYKKNLREKTTKKYNNLVKDFLLVYNWVGRSYHIIISRMLHCTYKMQIMMIVSFSLANLRTKQDHRKK